MAAVLRRVRGQLTCVELSATVLQAPVSSGPQRCVRTCGLAPASSLPLGRRLLRNIGQVDEMVAMLFFPRSLGRGASREIKTRMRLPPLAEEAKGRGAREHQKNALQEGGGQPKLALIAFPTTTRISSLCLMLLLKRLARA